MLLRRVRTAVKDETGGQQVPWENGSIEGEFYFNGTGGGATRDPSGVVTTAVEPFHRYAGGGGDLSPAAPDTASHDCGQRWG